MADITSQDLIDEVDEDKPKKHEHIHKKHEMHKHYMEHDEHKRHKKHETAAWTFGILSLILAILFIAAIVTKGFSGGSAGAATTSGTVISADALKTKTVTYLNALLQGQNQSVSVDNVKDVGDLYNLQITIGGRKYDSYARKDGSFLFPSGIDLTQAVAAPAANAQAPQPTNVPKTDKPKVELFVMAYCPYGTQAEKGILPAVRTLLPAPTLAP